jgi:hypothetical protein
MWRTKPILQTYVDWSNKGFEDGTYAHPYNTIKEGVAGANSHGTITIWGGEYNETGDIIIDKPVDLKSQGDVTIR